MVAGLLEAALICRISVSFPNSQHEYMGTQVLDCCTSFNWDWNLVFFLPGPSPSGTWCLYKTWTGSTCRRASWRAWGRAAGWGMGMREVGLQEGIERRAQWIALQPLLHLLPQPAAPLICQIVGSMISFDNFISKFHFWKSRYFKILSVGAQHTGCSVYVASCIWMLVVNLSFSAFHLEPSTHLRRRDFILMSMSWAMGSE